MNVDAPSAGDLDRLVAAALAVRPTAYAPASGFQVGAAVLTRAGAVHVGCNVENASYGLTVCAERHAVAAAVAAGSRELLAVAVATGLDDPARPCGACRQVLAEFGKAMTVVPVGNGSRRVVTDLATLLPEPFTFGGGGTALGRWPRRCFTRRRTRARRARAAG